MQALIGTKLGSKVLAIAALVGVVLVAGAHLLEDHPRPPASAIALDASISNSYTQTLGVPVVEIQRSSWETTVGYIYDTDCALSNEFGIDVDGPAFIAMPHNMMDGGSYRWRIRNPHRSLVLFDSAFTFRIGGGGGAPPPQRETSVVCYYLHDLVVHAGAANAVPGRLLCAWAPGDPEQPYALQLERRPTLVDVKTITVAGSVP